MNYLLLGTGNMAYFLAGRLHQAGWSCKGIWGRDANAAQRLAETVGAPVISSLTALPEAVDVCILALSDHAIAEVAQQLEVKDAVVLHTAGSVPMDVLPQPHKAVLWPVYSIVKEKLPELRDIPLVCEANNERSRAAVLAMAQALSGNVQLADTRQRQWMHLIAALSNNFTNHILAIAELLSREQQVDFSLFHPILQQTFERIRSGSAIDSQTGAAKRGDVTTQQQHLSLLSGHPQWQELYKALSGSIKDLYSPDGK